MSETSGVGGNSNAAESARSAAESAPESTCTNPAENRACTPGEVGALEGLGSAMNSMAQAQEQAEAAKAATNACDAQAAAQQAQEHAKNAQDAADAAAEAAKDDPSRAAEQSAQNAQDAADAAARAAAEATAAVKSLGEKQGFCPSTPMVSAPSVAPATVSQLAAISVSPVTPGMPSTYAGVAFDV